MNGFHFEENIADTVKDSLMHYLSIHNTAYSEFYTLKTCYHSSPSTNSLNTVLAWNEIHASYPYSYNFWQGTGLLHALYHFRCRYGFLKWK